MSKTVRMVVCCVALVAVAAPVWAQGKVSISTVGAPGDNRKPIAIPDYGCAPGNESVAKTLTDALVFDLTFTGLFRVLPKTNFPAGFTGWTENVQDASMDAWKKTGAESVVHAFLKVEGKNLVAECFLLDTASGSPVVGRRFTTQVDSPRLISHKFSEEIVKYVDGTPGIATSRVFFSAGKPGLKELYAADYDGYNATRLTFF